MKTDELIALLARQPDVPPRGRPRRDWWLASLAGLAAAFVLMALLLGPRPDLGAALAEPLFQQKAGTLALMALSAGWAAYLSGLPGRTGRIAGTMRWLGPAWLLAATALAVLATPAGERLALFQSPTILVCLAMVPTLAVLPAAALIWALRRAAPTDPRRAARAVGWAAGGIGAFAYAFHCEADQPGYVLLWYGLALAITVLAVQAIASRWLRW